MTAAKEMESMRTIGKYQNPGGAAVLCVESSLAQGSCFNVSVMNCPLILSLTSFLSPILCTVPVQRT